MTDMERTRFTEEQIIGFLQRTEVGLPIKEVCGNGGFRDATSYEWRSKSVAWMCPTPGGWVSLKVRTPSSRNCWPNAA
ncbi:MAG: transposase [Rhodoferax sp.]|nr:transposase [Rhodoferax sp.]